MRVLKRNMVAAGLIVLTSCCGKPPPEQVKKTDQITKVDAGTKTKKTDERPWMKYRRPLNEDALEDADSER